MGRRRKNNDDWVDDLMKIGLGVLAVAFIAKLAENKEQITKCPYCNAEIGKWARTCPSCRNTLTI